jgi:hypothetical protein
MAQWIAIGFAGTNRARRAPAHVHKTLRERWPFRRPKDPPNQRPGKEHNDT